MGLESFGGGCLRAGNRRGAEETNRLARKAMGHKAIGIDGTGRGVAEDIESQPTQHPCQLNQAP